MTTPTTPTNSLVKGINHTGFTVTNMTRILDFLENGLGFSLTPTLPRDKAMMETVIGVKDADVMIAYAQAPGHRLEIHNYSGPEDRTVYKPRACDDGFWHLALDVYDIDAAVEVGRKYEFIGISDPQEVSHGPNVGNYCVYLQDPHGLTIELIGPRIA